MIGAWWRPPRPRVARRTPTYTLRRFRKPRRTRSCDAPRAERSNTSDMIFDHRAELPTATLLPRDSSAQLSLDARNWFGKRWQWLRPRTVPVLVAFVGMLAILASANYLRNLAREAPEQVTLKPLELHVPIHEPTTTATHGSLVVTNIKLEPTAEK